MPAELVGVFWLLVLLQLKHVVADFGLLTRYMLANRMKYGHPGGLMHVGVHLVGTSLVLWAMETALPLSIGILVAEGLFHYHVDYLKARWAASSGATPEQAIYWYVLGADQAAHQLSYIAIAAWWAAA